MFALEWLEDESELEKFTLVESLLENHVHSSIFIYSSVPRNIIILYSSVTRTDESIYIDEYMPVGNTRHSRVCSSVNRRTYPDNQRSKMFRDGSFISLSLSL
jgi:hypothetical protein